jgi:hypothetical protein
MRDNHPYSPLSRPSEVIYLKLRRVGSGPSLETDVIGTKVLIFLVVSSWITLLGLITLQMVGLGSAVTGLRDAASPPQKIWCSPGFQLAANPNDTTNSLGPAQSMIFDGTCEVNYTVTINSQGTGCIALDGDQPAWLKATAIVVSFQLLLQIVDIYLLFQFQNSNGSWLQLRPVCTMVTGVFVWGFLTIASGVQTKDYPLVSGVVAVIGPAQPDCKMQLDSAGLRGEIIAWSDGVFSALRTAYFGPFGLD